MFNFNDVIIRYGPGHSASLVVSVETFTNLRTTLHHKITSLMILYLQKDMISPSSLSSAPDPGSPSLLTSSPPRVSTEAVCVCVCVCVCVRCCSIC